MGRRDMLLLSILTLITTLVWIVFDVYHATVTSTIAQDVEAQLAPITPTFNRTLIEELEKREHIDPLATSSSSPVLLPQNVVPTATTSGQQKPNLP